MRLGRAQTIEDGGPEGQRECEHEAHPHVADQGEDTSHPEQDESDPGSLMLQSGEERGRFRGKNSKTQPPVAKKV
jgi:hypothetical protein